MFLAVHADRHVRNVFLLTDTLAECEFFFSTSRVDLMRRGVGDKQKHWKK